MMRNLKVALACVAMAALSGCVSTNATVFDKSQTLAKITPDEVRIYRTARQVPYVYREIAILNSAGDSFYTTESNMAQSMRVRAAKLGANGIILDGITEPGAGAKVAAAFLGTSAERKGRSIAIFIEANQPISDQSSPQITSSMRASRSTSTISKCKVDPSTGSFYDCASEE